MLSGGRIARTAFQNEARKILRIGAGREGLALTRMQRMQENLNLVLPNVREDKRGAFLVEYGKSRKMVAMLDSLDRWFRSRPGTVPFPRRLNAFLTESRRRVAKGWTSEKAMQEHLREHPFADPKDHWVEKAEGRETTLEKDVESAADLKGHPERKEAVDWLLKKLPDDKRKDFAKMLERPKELGETVDGLKKWMTSPPGRARFPKELQSLLPRYTWEI